jgi:tRNA threonylcarbamoyladenosine modification (KEOPS) complex  Pcc1 subunit
VLRIEARDLPALRAALNSYLRWIKIAEDMNRMAGA